jgi:signal transduction histidine kinase
VTPIVGERGHSMGAAIILRDVTARRELMNELMRVNAMKDDFLAVLSHELRTPLTPVMGWVALLRRAGRENQEVFEQALEAIERNTQVQKRLVDDLIDTTRIASGKLLLEPRAFSLNWLLEGILQSAQNLASERDIRIEAELSSDVPPLFLDSERLQQVVINVLSNAVKFSEEGSVVHLRTRLQNATNPEYSRAVIEVEDNGCGIAPEVLPRIFERFYQGDNTMTRRHGGLGLGLNVSRTLVELHGGTIEVHSRGENMGTRAVITLPLRIAATVVR